MKVLERALELTTGDRRRDYDHPLNNHLMISLMGSMLFRTVMNPIDVAMFIGYILKLSRHVKTSKWDNFVDTAGYINCIDMMCKLYYETQITVELEKTPFDELDDGEKSKIANELRDLTLEQQITLLFSLDSLS